MKALVQYLASWAKTHRLRERAYPGSAYKMLGEDEDTRQRDPELFRLMQNISQAKRAFDDYILAKTEEGDKR